MRTLLLSIATATMLTAGTLAASAATTAPAENPGPVEQNSKAMAADDMAAMPPIRKQIEDQLTKSGYTAVQVIPSSFLVRAKDKQGNPVEMVIGPDSLTTITEVAPAMAKSGAPAMQATPAPKG